MIAPGNIERVIISVLIPTCPPCKKVAKLSAVAITAKAPNVTDPATSGTEGNIFFLVDYDYS